MKPERRRHLRYRVTMHQLNADIHALEAAWEAHASKDINLMQHWPKRSRSRKA